jgi:hypothetical protein
MKWAEAVRAWNAKHNAGGKYRIPAKGTPAYEQVREMMGSEAPKASAPKAPRAVVHHEGPAADEARKHKKMGKVLEFLRAVAKKHKAEKAEKEVAAKAAEKKEESARAKLGRQSMMAQLEESLRETTAAAAAAPPIRRRKLLEEALRMKRELSKLKKEMKA